MIKNNETLLKRLHTQRAVLISTKEETERLIAEIDGEIDAVYLERGMDPLLVHCKKSSRVVNSWPAWKRNAAQAILTQPLDSGDWVDHC